MSGTRLTRKVTVEGSKKLPEGGGQSSSSSSGTRRSVFDRLGPGTSEAVSGFITVGFFVILTDCSCCSCALIKQDVKKYIF